MRTAVDRAFGRWAAEARARGVSLRWSGDAGPAPVFPGLEALGPVLEDLLGLAVRGSDRGQSLTVSVSGGVSPGAVRLTVQNRGPRLDPGTLAQLYLDQGPLAEAASRARSAGAWIEVGSTGDGNAFSLVGAPEGPGNPGHF